MLFSALPFEKRYTMPVIEWDGVPLFGGKTIVISGAMFKGRPKAVPKTSAPPHGEDSPSFAPDRPRKR